MGAKWMCNVIVLLHYAICDLYVLYCKVESMGVSNHIHSIKDVLSTVQTRQYTEDECTIMHWQYHRFLPSQDDSGRTEELLKKKKSLLYPALHFSFFFRSNQTFSESVWNYRRFLFFFLVTWNLLHPIFSEYKYV